MWLQLQCCSVSVLLLYLQLGLCQEEVNSTFSANDVPTESVSAKDITALKKLLVITTTPTTTKKPLLCKNGGTPMRYLDICQCPPNIIGPTCERFICRNHGRFIVSENVCRCTDHYKGKFCETINQDSCGEHGSHYSEWEGCVCMKGYEGTKCERKKDTSRSRYGRVALMLMAVVVMTIVAYTCWVKYNARNRRPEGGYVIQPPPSATRHPTEQSYTAVPRTQQADHSTLHPPTAPPVVFHDSPLGDEPPPAYEDVVASSTR